MARLYTEGDFLRRLGEQFAGEMPEFPVRPAVLAKPGPDGRPRKLRFAPGCCRYCACWLRHAACAAPGPTRSDERRTERSTAACSPITKPTSN